MKLGDSGLSEFVIFYLYPISMCQIMDSVYSMLFISMSYIFATSILSLVEVVGKLLTTFCRPPYSWGLEAMRICQSIQLLWDLEGDYELKSQICCSFEQLLLARKVTEIGSCLNSFFSPAHSPVPRVSRSRNRSGAILTWTSNLVITAAKIHSPGSWMWRATGTSHLGFFLPV